MIYFLQRENGDIKIGTTKYYTSRRSKLKSEHGELKLIASIEGSYKLEKELHREFRNFWTGDGECFQDVPEIRQYIASQECLPTPEPAKEWKGQTPYYLHRLAKSQGKTPEQLVKEALEKAGNPHAAAKLLDVSHDTINSFMKVRGWQLEQCNRVIEPETESVS